MSPLEETDVALISPEIQLRPATPDDASLVHALYLKTPAYFEIISIPLPSLFEVETELSAGENDLRRFTELILLLAPNSSLPQGAQFDPVTGLRVVGYLDYKLDYPSQGDATVNLLLIEEGCQGKGIGRRVMSDLEERLQGRVSRVLASIYGRNPGAERFWTSLGYVFAIDAQPVLDWYAKELA